MGKDIHVTFVVLLNFMFVIEILNKTLYTFRTVYSAGGRFW